MAAKKLKIVERDEWENFADAYLSLARLGLEKALELKDGGKENIYLILPSLFNLKHGIEMMLKTLTIWYLGKDHLSGADLTHDLDEIFSQFKKQIPKRRVQDAIEELKRKQPDLPHEDLNTENIFEEMEDLVFRYVTLDVLKSKISRDDLTFLDLNNTALRYPSNDISLQVDYSSVIEKFDSSDIQLMLRDCQKAKILLWKLLLIQLNENGVQS